MKLGDFRNMPGPGDFMPHEYSMNWIDEETEHERKREAAYSDLLAGEEVAHGNGVMDFLQAIEPIADEIGAYASLMANAETDRQILATAKDFRSLILETLRKTAEEIV